jgi:type IV pilus assembly protein PilN
LWPGHAPVSVVILINLLPHREAARKRRRERFLFMLALSVASGAVVAGAVYLAQAAAVAAQRERNDILGSEIRRLDSQIKDISHLRQEIAALRARQQAVEDLQADRNMPVHLLRELVEQLPDGIYLTGLRQDPQVVVLQGVAQSNERVSEMLRNLGHRSVWLAQPELVEIVASSVNLGPREQRRVANFQVRVRLVRAGETASTGRP